MKKLQYTCCSLLAFSPVLGLNAGKKVAHETVLPNIVLIITDDQGWGDVQANGNTHIHTPVLNSLLNSSAVFERFYATPLSATTRASLLTGRYHLRTGSIFVQSGLENMNPEETTIAEVLKEVGYSTGCFGKWHNGAYFPYSPNGQGFDEFLGFTSGHWANYFDPELQHNEKRTQGKGYITDIFTDAALRFIEKNKKRPFFCYVPYNAPHSPFQVPDHYFDKYDQSLPIKNATERAIVASVYGMVENVDYNIGRIIQRLDELQLRENTIIIFLSDNGPALKGVERFNGSMRGSKGEVHEGGVRVPCLINWKNTIPSGKISQMASVIDLFPTIQDICNIKRTHSTFPVDGVSLKNNLFDPKAGLPKRYLFTHRYTGKLSPVTGSLRTGDLCLTVVKDSILLFDLAKDPSQKRNIYDENNPGHLTLLLNYQNWFKETSQTINSQVLVPIGYENAPEVRIAATDGKLHGGLKIHGAPNDNWVNGFENISDSLCIDIDVRRKGKYQFEIEYATVGYNQNVLIGIECNNSTISRTLPPFLSKRLPNHDRVDRFPAAYPQTWGRLKAGKMKLSEGKYRLKIYVTNAESPTNIQLRRILLTNL